MSRVAVVIPNWNGAAWLPETLTALRAQSYPNFEVIVVDNGSEDASVEIVESSFPEVVCIPLETNVGFAAGVNIGIRATEAEYIVLLNNDAVPEEGWLEALVDRLDHYPDIGSCASRVLSYREPEIIDSAGDQFGIFPSQMGHGRPDGARYDRPALVFSACACAAAYRREMFETVGLFDERFFAYMEDVDLGARAQFFGFDCLYVPEAVVLHHGSLTADRVPAFKFYLHMRNALFIFFQYAPLGRLLLWTPFVLVMPFLAALIERQSVRVAAQALRDVIKDWRTVLSRRREVAKEGSLDWGSFAERLGPPLPASRLWKGAPEARRPLPTGGGAGET